MKRYSEILAELEALVEKMNRGEISIDELGPAVKTAAKQIKALRDKLKSTEVEISQVLKELDDED